MKSIKIEFVFFYFRISWFILKFVFYWKRMLNLSFNKCHKQSIFSSLGLVKIQNKLLESVKWLTLTNGSVALTYRFRKMFAIFCSISILCSINFRFDILLFKASWLLEMMSLQSQLKRFDFDLSNLNFLNATLSNSIKLKKEK